MNKKSFYILLIILFFVRFWISLYLFNNDVLNHIVWGKSILAKGLKGFYLRDYSPNAQANYPPLINLFFLLEHKLYLFFFANVDINILASFYRLQSLLSDIIIIALLPRLTSVFFFNPALFYNSVFWGQTESVVALFIFLSLIFFYRKRKIFSFVFFGLALLIKQSSLFFLPVFLVLVFKKTNLKQKIAGFSLIYLLAVLSFAFFAKTDYFLYPFTFYLKTIGGQEHQHLASVNAFNFWYLARQNGVPDSKTFLFLTYRQWSLFLTCIFLMPILFVFYKKPTLRNGFYTTGLFNLVIFLFLTRMHERYLYPTLVFLLPILTSPLGYFLYFILSAIHFLNLYYIWREPRMNIILRFLNSKNVVYWLSLISIIVFFALFVNNLKLYFKKKC